MISLAQPGSVFDNTSEQVFCKSFPHPFLAVHGLVPPPPFSVLWKGKTMTRQLFPKKQTQDSPAPTLNPTSTSHPAISQAHAEVGPSLGCKRLITTELPLAWILNPEKGISLSDRILARLALAEARAVDVWIKDDLRQSFLTVYLAAEGNPIPFVEASYRCYGVHPEKLFQRITEMRKATLGPEYEPWFDAAGNLRPDAPKKLSSSSPRNEDKTDAA